MKKPKKQTNKPEVKVTGDEVKKTKIKVIGIGGGGGKAVTRMVDHKISGVDFITINTDAQDLHHTTAHHKIHIGKNLTKGLGAGMNPEVGRQDAGCDPALPGLDWPAAGRVRLGGRHEPA